MIHLLLLRLSKTETLELLPFSEATATLIDLGQRRQYKAFIAWHSVANFYYLVNSKSKDMQTRNFLKDLMTFTEIPPTTTRDAKYALDLPVPDFEDALQIAAARACQANYIITRNVIRYRKSPIPAKKPQEILKQYYLKR